MAQASVASMLKALNDVNTADKSSKVYQQAARFLKASNQIKSNNALLSTSSIC